MPRHTDAVGQATGRVLDSVRRSRHDAGHFFVNTSFEPRTWLVVLAAGALACGGAAADRADDGEVSEDALTRSSPSRVGDLFLNACHDVGSSLVCQPRRMSIFTTARTTQTQTTSFASFTFPTSRHSTLLGSTADVANHRVFWHADCNSRYQVTDIETGAVTSFTIDLDRLGLRAPGGMCLGEWVFDKRTNRAIALAGSMERAGPLRGKSTLDYVLSLDARGDVRVLWDVRSRLDARWRLLHEFQTIAELDADRNEIIVPLAAIDGEARAVISLSTGAVQQIGEGGCRQHAFFDEATRRPTFFDCTLPGWSSDVAPVTGAPRITMDANQLRRAGLDPGDLGHRGFVGGGYDPRGRKAYVLFRKPDVGNDRDTFLLAIGDLANDRFAGVVKTDLTYGATRADQVVVATDTTFFWAVELLPR